jgi:hypothetical protein
MLLRWHIITPAYVFCKPSKNNKFKDSYLYSILTDTITTQSNLTGQALEDYILNELSAHGGPRTHGHLTLINEWTEVPQQGLVIQNVKITYYHLKLDDPTLNSGIGDDVRFRFEEQGL